MNVLNLRALLYALTLSGFGIVSTFGNFIDASRILTIPYRACYLVICLIIILANCKPVKYKDINILIILLLAFWVLYLTKFILLFVVSDLVFSKHPYEYLVFVFGVVFIPLLAAIRNTGLEVTNKAFNYSFNLLFLTVFVSAIQLFVRGSNTELIRYTGNDILNPISLAHAGVGVALLGIFALKNSNKITNQKTIYYWIAICLGLIVQVATASRSALLSFVVIACLMLVKHMRIKTRIRSLGNIVFQSLLFPILCVAIYKFSTNINNIFVDRVILGFSNDSGRFQIWKEAIFIFKQSPLWGAGFEISTGQYPHNIILESFMFLGIVGGSLLTLFIFLVTLKSLRKIYLGSPSSWLNVVFVQYVLLAMFSGAIYTHDVFWFFAAAVSAENSR